MQERFYPVPFPSAIPPDRPGPRSRVEHHREPYRVERLASPDLLGATHRVLMQLSPDSSVQVVYRDVARRCEGICEMLNAAHAGGVCWGLANLDLVLRGGEL